MPAVVPKARPCEAVVVSVKLSIGRLPEVS